MCYITIIYIHYYVPIITIIISPLLLLLYPHYYYYYIPIITIIISPLLLLLYPYYTIIMSPL